MGVAVPKYHRGMRHVFHTRVDLAADTTALVPLSDLATIDTAAYEAAIAKYEGSPERRRLRDTVIPLLHLGWTEVVFLSPIHPHASWQAWQEITGEALPRVEFWAIPIDDLPDDAVIFDRTTSVVGEAIDPTEVVPLNRASFLTSMGVPDRNRQWLRELAGSGRRGAWFNRLPHVLTAGPVTLDHAQVISWVESAG
nr:hypothetical protein [Microbacterium bovistercoris]